MASSVGLDDLLATSTDLADIERTVRRLKNERDMWKAKTATYKAAFDVQTRQLREALDLCFATQAELENERAGSHRQNDSLNTPPKSATLSVKDSEGTRSSQTLGCDGALDHVYGHADVEWQSTPLTQSRFGRVEQLISQQDFSKARKEIDRVLPGPLPIEARIEALLLKSAICRASGPDWALEGLAQCSEALSLCNDLSSLEFLLPKIQYHRGLCHYLLRELSKAREAFAAVSPTDPLHERASEYRKSCDDIMEAAELAKRRSAFEEHRTYTEGYLASIMEGKRHKSWRRPSSTRNKLRKVSRNARASLPPSWMFAKLAKD